MIPITKKLVRSYFQPRPKQAHKGFFGHVLVVAGSQGMSGAGVLACLGALRGGAGLVTLAIPQSLAIPILYTLPAEAMSLALPESRLGSVCAKSVDPLLQYIQDRKISSLVIGPGLSRNKDTVQFMKKLWPHLQKLELVVCDADAFVNAASFAKNPKLWKSLSAIVTPHIGEFQKFLGHSVPESKRSQAAMAFAKKYSVTCVLKSHVTLVCQESEIFQNTTGNPGLARGGSGDVLAGLIAGLHRNVSGLNKNLGAAVAAVYLHGLAADLAVSSKTEWSLLTSEMAQFIPQAIKKTLYA